MTSAEYYTEENLQRKQAELARMIERFDNYSGNNPNKYQSQIRSLRESVELIRSVLADAALRRAPV